MSNNEKNKTSKRKLAFDMSLIFALLFIGVASFLIMNSFKKDGKKVVVSVRGEVVAEYSLTIDGEYVLNGGTNTLVIENGEAYMKSATCPGYPPEKRCTNQGRISKTLEMIVCAPNGVDVIIK